MSVIELRNINKIFGNKISRVHVLKNINFSAENNQFNLVLGPSGSGKSTFLTIAGGLQKPTSGQVNIEGQPIEGLSSKDRDTLRLNKIAFILQSYNLLPYLTVKEQFVLVDKVKNKGNLDSSSLDSLLKKLGIEELQEKYPGENYQAAKISERQLQEHCTRTPVLYWRTNRRHRWIAIM